MDHELKIWPRYYDQVAAGRKPWEMRKADRPFRRDDTLSLYEFDPHTGRYTGRVIDSEVFEVFRPVDYAWIPRAHVLLTLVNTQERDDYPEFPDDVDDDGFPMVRATGATA